MAESGLDSFNQPAQQPQQQQSASQPSASLADMSGRSLSGGGPPSGTTVSTATPSSSLRLVAMPPPTPSSQSAADYLAYKRRRSMSFEANPTVRKRQANRLLAKLKATINEFATRVGQQAVVVLTSGKSSTGSNETPMGIKVFGASPLDSVIRREKEEILKELQAAALYASTQPAPPVDKFDLPRLVVDGVHVPLDKMTQAQLRAFIPGMLKSSLQRGKPGWGKEELRPEWWPHTVPWQNVRSDGRDIQQKEQQTWTDALRSVIHSCYQYHDRLDLLSEKSPEEAAVDASKGVVVSSTGAVSSPALEQQLIIQQSALQQIPADGTILLQHHSLDPSSINIQDMYILTSDGGQVVIPTANQQVEVTSVAQGNVIAQQESNEAVEVDVDINA